MTDAYRGTRETDGGTLFVTLQREGAKETALAPRFDLRRHSPTGFECGYEGSGPAQLALAMCADHLKRHPVRAESAGLLLEELEPLATIADRVALAVYQDFKRVVVAPLPRAASWTVSDEQVGKAIDTLIAARVAANRARAAS